MPRVTCASLFDTVEKYTAPSLSFLEVHGAHTIRH